jgi:hypothetical protein
MVVSPPGIVLRKPKLILIPDTKIFYVVDAEIDIFYYEVDGYWYCVKSGVWYRAESYSGPWVKIEIGNVPPSLLNLPPGWRKIPPGQIIRKRKRRGPP